MMKKQNQTHFPDPLPVVALDQFCTFSSGSLRESSGVRPVTMDEIHDHFYLPNACVPTSEWRDISHQIVSVEDIDKVDALSKVGLFSLPPDLKLELSAFMARYAEHKPVAMKRSLYTSDLLQFIKTYLVDRFQGGGAILDLGGPGFNSPGLYTVTVNRKLGQLQGLHLDSWYGNGLCDRLIPRCRVVLNFGPVARWLLYVPIPLMQIWSTLKILHPHQFWNDKTAIGEVDKALLHLRANVRALRLNPGEGYIAATEAVIHDATTYWANRTSYNYQLMGDFDWLSNKASSP